MISYTAAAAQIYAPALPARTAKEKRVRDIATLTRVIDSAQTWLDQFEKNKDETHAKLYRDFIRRKKLERDALLVVPIVAQDSETDTKN